MPDNELTQAEADLEALQKLLAATEGWDDPPAEADDFIRQTGDWSRNEG